MQRAATLLTKAAFLPVKEVAIMSGFDDANYFSKGVQARIRAQSDRVSHHGHVRIAAQRGGYQPLTLGGDVTQSRCDW